MSILERLLPTTGQLVSDRYELVEEIGRGGFGVVYKAVQVGLDEEVALKLLLPHVLDNEDIVSRFQREVAVAKSLRHPNAIRILDVNTTDKGIPYYVMEYVRGRPLDNVLRDEGRISPARTQRIMLQMLKSLGEAHSKGVVHRDLKPGNLMVSDIYGETDFVKVLDFGIAKALAADGLIAQTSTGMVLGTPAYMSPEQATGVKDLDGRSDLYAAGLIMAECLVGHPVVSGETPYVIVAIHAMPTPLNFSAELQHSQLWPIIYRATLKDRDQRFRSAEEMVAALNTLTDLPDTVSAAGLSNQVYSPPPSVPGFTPAPHLYESGQLADYARPPGEVSSGLFGQSGQQVVLGETGRPEAATMFGGVPDSGAAQAKSNTGKTVAVILVLLLLLGGGVFAVIKVLGGSDPVTPTAVSVTEGAAPSQNPDQQQPDEPLPPETEVVVNDAPAPRLPDPQLATAVAISSERIGSAVPAVRAVSFGGTDNMSVFWNGQIVGVTPFSGLFPRVDRDLEMTFSRDGYHGSTEAVSLLRQDVEIELRRRRRERNTERDDSPSEPSSEGITPFGETPSSSSPFGQTNIHD